MCVISLLAHVQMCSHDAVSGVVNAQTCFAKLIGDSVVATGFAHQKIGVNFGQWSPEGPHVLAQRCDVRVELKCAILANIVA